MKEKRVLNSDGEILNREDLKKHLEKIATTHNLKSNSNKETYPVPQMIDNFEFIRNVYNILNEHVKLNIVIHPAGEWLLDNFYVIEEVVKSIQKNLSLSKYKNFLGIKNGKNYGFARVYVLASEIVNYTDCKIDETILEECLEAYQTKKSLSMDEIWNIGIFMQIAIIEKIRQISEVIYISEIEKYKVESIVERLVEEKPKDELLYIKKPKKILEITENVKYPFVEYLSYKLKKYGKKTESYLGVLEEEIEKTGNTVSDVIKKEHFDIAIQKVSIGNSITSLKRINRINFLEIFEKVNDVEEILKSDPADVYRKMDYQTKDEYRRKIKEISKSTKISEIYIAKKLIELANEGKVGEKTSHIGYYLFGKNTEKLYKKLQVKPRKILSNNTKVKLYISSITVITIILSVVTSLNIFNITKSKVTGVISFLIFLIPFSELTIKIIEYILSKFIKPKIIPKLDFYNGIDEENTTMVVIPTIIKTKDKIEEIMNKMEVYYLANKSKNLYFCLLGDCSESNVEVEEYDKELVDFGLKITKKLNEKYKVENFPIFHFIYRKRYWNDKESSYLGWERKRGALTEFAEILGGIAEKKGKLDKYNCNTIIENLKIMPNFKYIITLDSDTDLTLNSAFELVGAMAHILNKPEVKNGKVIEGYGLIQPRVGVNIDISYQNLFTKIFAGSGGIDSYTNAISDIYQDNFGEGIFTGKGIFNLECYLKVLKNEIPENKVLSHDLLEGNYLRCGLASDILLMDGYPTKYSSFMVRLSRWIRGDWQIIEWLKNKKMNLLSKYKIFDNLRRSLFEISIVFGIVFLFIIRNKYKINVNLKTILLYFIVIMPFFLEFLNHIIQKKDGEKKQVTFLPKFDGIIGSIIRAALTLSVIPYKAYISLKSILKTLYRLIISKRNLLEWTTSEEAERNSKNDVGSYYKNMFINVIAGVIICAISYKFKDLVSFIIGIMWIVAPFAMCNISKTKGKKDAVDYLSNNEKDFCIEIASKTFQFFKDNLTIENNYLIPDNYQYDRKKEYVDRTSSTNIGLSLLAIVSGIDLNFISKEEGIELLKNMLNSIESLEKWHGHLYNWYDIKTKKPLYPRYISTVDSGNFIGYLFVLKVYLIGLEDEFDCIKDLIEIITNMIDNAEFSYLYSEKNRLFSIGFNIEENKLTDSYYDLLASEARQASFIAIAKKDVPTKHWNCLNRTLTILNNRKGLISWSGTAFEYMMPNINIKRYEGSLLDESCKFALMSQIEYSKKLNIPWGISESAFNLKDLHHNYQYKAFGIPWLGLKRGLADEMVVSSYASILAILDKPKEVVQNLMLLKEYGMYNKYGFYESIDFTPSRQKKNETFSVVKTYMAHHQGLILLSINNLINKNILQKRFSLNPEIKANEILLQERMPETFITTKEQKEKLEKLKYKDYENYTSAVYNNDDNRITRGNVISNEKYTVAINQFGEGFSKYKNIYVNRFKITEDYMQGILFFIKNVKSKKAVNVTKENSKVFFMPDQVKFERVEGNIKTKLRMVLDQEEAVEIRRLELENIGNTEESLEVSCKFEPILSSKEQDYAHPSFNSLFLMMDYDENEKILEVKRRKRGNNEKEMFLEAMFSTDATVLVDNEFETDKEKLQVRGELDIPYKIKKSIPFSNKVGLTTEPVVAMRKTIKLAPNEKKSVDLIISISEDREKAKEHLTKYKNIENVKRTFEISKANSEAESRYLQIKGKQINLFEKILSYIIFENPLKKNFIKDTTKVYNREDFWKYGISGDLPIIVLKIKDANDIYVVNTVLKLYEFILTKNMEVDIVLIDEEKSVGERYVREEIESKILDSHLAYKKNIRGGIFVFSKDEIKNEDMKLFEFASSICIDAKKGDLEYVIKDLEEEYLKTKQESQKIKHTSVINKDNIQNIDILKEENKKYFNEYGAFSPSGKEYLIKSNKNNKLPTVWSHILANEKFGTVVTESMGGYTWYKNCRLNRISVWENNAFLDIPSEIIYIQDEETGETWSLGQNPIPDENNYMSIFGFGYAKYIHESNGILQENTVFVPKEDSIKINLIKLTNNTLKKKKIKIVYFVKPVLGEDEIKSNEYIKLKFDEKNNLVIAQNMYESNFKSMAYVSSCLKIKSYTGDKKSFLGKGGISNPDGLNRDKLSNDSGIGTKPCIAIEFKVELESMSSKEFVINLGAEENYKDIQEYSCKYNDINICKQELDAVKNNWKEVLEKLQVYTELESLNIFLNGWCLYQTISSRLLAKSGFYQSGGAYGFRDQLQDTLALKYSLPERMKRQILLHSKHQFIEGDVEHWWHEETSRGIRTKFSDDLLWLVYVTEEYIKVTGDYEILDIELPFLKGDILQEDQDERYDLYLETDIKESLYNHCIKAINKSLNFGKRKLPKIGSGDWNDGFSNVGVKGIGESVWLGFFLYDILKKFIPICKLRKDFELAKRYEEISEELKKALNTVAWDGRWYKRAFTDDGKVLGTIENDECRIDGIAQSWSVISGAGDNDKKIISMENLENYLVDKKNGIIKLLDPPFDKGDLNPGYIKAYVPGVRENGGQYTHGSCWAIIAEALLGFGDKAIELYRMINPIEHSRTKEEAEKYKVEPYVIAADIYGAKNLAGMGGWTWYTGSSSWYYQAGIEYILGFRIENNKIKFSPCIPKGWKEYSIRYKYKDSIYNIKIKNLNHKNGGVTKVLVNGKDAKNEIYLDGSGKIFNVEVEI